MSKARWMLERFRSMPKREIPHRIRERKRIVQERMGLFSARVLSVEQKKQALPVFPNSNSDSCSEAMKAQILKEAAQICSGNFELLGVQRANPFAWGMDPSGVEWPKASSAHLIDIRHDTEGKDIKQSWELLKMQHLQITAWAAAFGDRESLDFTIAGLRSWLDWDVSFQNIAYAAGFETGCRLMSWLVVFTLIEEHLNPLKEALWQSIADQLDYIRRYPSLYSSANNHRAAELVTLFVYEVLAPDIADGSPLKTARELEKLIDTLFYPDGVGTEHSVHYQANTLEWILVAHCVAKHKGVQLKVDNCLKQGADFLSYVCTENGQFFDFGDNDSSVVLRQTIHEELLPRSICGSICAHLNFSEGPLGWNFGLRELILGIKRPLKQQYKKIEGRLFPDGGYTVFKSGGKHLLFDHAPLGFPSTAGHGHADALAVWLFYKGQPIWVDWGTYRYNGDPKWRTLARSTASHNTIQIDNKEQSEMVGGFNWRRRAKCQLLFYDKEASVVRAQHDGYAHLGIVHQREVAVKEQSIVITDVLKGSGQAKCSIRFWLAPGLNVEQRGEDWFVISDSICLRLELNCSKLEQWSLSVEDQEYSPRYQHLEPTKVIVVRGTPTFPVELSSSWHWVE